MNSTNGSCTFLKKKVKLSSERRGLRMNQEKIGRFIAKRRKENGFTQVALAEKLGITDRAISKWENGKSLPDPSIMLELCELLHMNVNELLTGERLDKKDYKVMAENNLMELARQEELNNKKFLVLESVIGWSCSVSFLILIFAASFAVTISAWRILMILTGSVIFVIGMYCSMKLEHDAGYYECPNCGKRYVPSMRAMYLAPHKMRDRKMKCPFCNQRVYHKKVLTK